METLLWWKSVSNGKKIASYKMFSMWEKDKMALRGQ